VEKEKPCTSLNQDLRRFERLLGRKDSGGVMEFKYSEITERIIGCSMVVHAKLGNGFQEVIYQRALEIEMKLNGLKFEREFSMPIFYRNEKIGERRVDFFVDHKIMVELKALIQLENVHLAQAKNYLEAFNVEVGLLINFGATSLQFKRLTNKKITDSLFQ
jgi:GxxExxY protein